MSARPLLSARTAAAISLARRFIGWVAGRLFAYLYVNSGFWAKARSMTPGRAATAAVLRRGARPALAMVLSWGVWGMWGVSDCRAGAQPGAPMCRRSVGR